MDPLTRVQAQKRKGDCPMIVRVFDVDSGTTVYINPEYVVTLRPDPAHPENTIVVKLRDGETFRVQGTHVELAAKLGRGPGAQ
jgi:hypothetical protein